jgi:PAS domain S-box-containing protein
MMRPFAKIAGNTNELGTVYRDLFEKSPNGMVLFDTTGRIIEFNEAAHRQLGYSKEEFARLDIRDIDPFESYEGMRDKIRKVLDVGQATFDVRQKTKAGDLREVHVDTKVIQLSGRKVLYSTWRDMSDFNRSTELLRNVQFGLEKIEPEAIIAAIGNAMGIVSMDFKVAYQNQVSIELAGNHIGEYCYSAFEKRKAVCDGCPVVKSFKDGKIHTTIRCIRSDGEVSYFENTASVVRDSRGTIVAAIEVCRDITKHQRALSLKTLSRREYQILCMIGEGKRPVEIAKELSLKSKTIYTLRSRIFEKMGVKDNDELKHFVIENRFADWTYDDIQTRANRLTWIDEQ